ncbi:hypothetical protein V1478_008774 [Vespula squamosa]|uniref:Uncharacterized protein n=1 Tax=Vespula squamosa TaxID=30214 RepID=A0ABD2AUH1_VESSQ
MSKNVHRLEKVFSGWQVVDWIRSKIPSNVPVRGPFQSTRLASPTRSTPATPSLSLSLRPLCLMQSIRVHLDRGIVKAQCRYTDQRVQDQAATMENYTK